VRPREAEVCQFDLEVGGDQDVRELEVPVNHPVLPDDPERRLQFLQHALGPGFGQRPRGVLREVGLQVAELAVFEDEV